jgi:cholesterol oxidase
MTKMRNAKALEGCKLVGTQFSTNGDLLAFVHGSTEARDGVSQPRTIAADSGPVITSAFYARGVSSRTHMCIEDGGIPSFAMWIVQFSLLLRLKNALCLLLDWGRSWLRGDQSSNVGAKLAQLTTYYSGVDTWMPLLGMGQDTPGGKMELKNIKTRHEGTKELLQVTWDEEASRTFFKDLADKLGTLATQGLGGALRKGVLRHVFRRVVTTHPLGGCPMGTDERSGVVDEYGQVFGDANRGLFIVDGSVMPGPVGVNPALTIAAFADRAAKHLIETCYPDRRHRWRWHATVCEQEELCV